MRLMVTGGGATQIAAKGLWAARILNTFEQNQNPQVGQVAQPRVFIIYFWRCRFPRRRKCEIYIFILYFVFILYLFCIYVVFLLYFFCICFVFILYFFCIYFVFISFVKIVCLFLTSIYFVCILYLFCIYCIYIYI